MTYDPNENAKEALNANWEEFLTELDKNDDLPILFCPAGSRKVIDNTAVFRVESVEDPAMFVEGNIYQLPFKDLALAASPDKCEVWAAEVVRMCGDLDAEVFFKLILRIADNIRQEK
jgi:hypothetical protein